MVGYCFRSMNQLCNLRFNNPKLPCSILLLVLNCHLLLGQYPQTATTTPIPPVLQLRDVCVGPQNFMKLLLRLLTTLVA